MTTDITIRPKELEGEILSPDPAFDGRAIPGTYGAITRHPLRKVEMPVPWQMEDRGYRIHPIQCLHRRKCFYLRWGWSCLDCGENL